MRTLLTLALCLLCLIALPASAQTPAADSARIEVLRQAHSGLLGTRSALQAQLDSIESDIRAIEREINEIDLRMRPAGMVISLAKLGVLRRESQFGANTVGTVPAGTSLVATGFERGYWVVSWSGQTAYLANDYVRQNRQTEAVLGHPGNFPRGSASKGAADTTGAAVLTIASSDSLAVVYHTGPRGGCYFLNASGNKQYVDRSLCGGAVQPETRSSGTTPSGQTIHTGPRGGKYVITKSGKKRYVGKKGR